MNRYYVKKIEDEEGKEWLYLCLEVKETTLNAKNEAEALKKWKKKIKEGDFHKRMEIIPLHI